jgi:hypothetical protein
MRSEQGTVCGLVATSPAAPPCPPADRGTPLAYTAYPRTLSERLQYLRLDARRILANPGSHTRAELLWARDMVAAPASTEARR